MVKFIYIFLLVFFFILLSNRTTNAQTYYSCTWQSGTCNYSIGQPCEPFTTPTVCESQTQEECSIGGSFACDDCGTLGNICCNPSYNENQPPGGCEAGSLCISGVCEGCGDEGSSCCTSGSKCGDNLYCHTPDNPATYEGTGGTQCISCGGINEVCCNSFTSDGTLDPAPPGNCDSGLECDSGLCRCGGIGELCCPGDNCTDAAAICSETNPETGETVTEKRCWNPAPPVNCGALGEECCATGAACVSSLLMCDSATNTCTYPEETCDPGSTENTIDTAIGEINICSVEEATAAILRWSIGIIGGIAFLFYIYAGFLMKTSEGNPQKMQLSREIVVSTTAAVILLIFSVFLIKVLGFSLLGVFNL